MKGFYNQKLYEKAFAEYEIFLDDLLRLPKEEIVKRCYEKVYKEELVSVLEAGSFLEKDAKKIWELDYPLEALYREWLGNDYSCVDDLEQTIQNLIKKMQ